MSSSSQLRFICVNYRSIAIVFWRFLVIRSIIGTRIAFLGNSASPACKIKNNRRFLTLRPSICENSRKHILLYLPIHLFSKCCRQIGYPTCRTTILYKYHEIPSFSTTLSKLQSTKHQLGIKDGSGMLCNRSPS